jgi:aminopeptidase N
MRDANPQTIFLKDYTCPEYLIHKVELTFILDDENTQVSSRLTMSRNPDSKTVDKSLTLAGEHLRLLRISLNDGHDLTEGQYLQTQDSLIIHEVPQQQRFLFPLDPFFLGGRGPDHPPGDGRVERSYEVGKFCRF